MLKTIFSENKRPRLMKEFSFHDPYGRSKFYKKAVEAADSQKLAKLTGICGSARYATTDQGLSLLVLSTNR